VYRKKHSVILDTEAGLLQQVPFPCNRAVVAITLVSQYCYDKLPLLWVIRATRLPAFKAASPPCSNNAYTAVIMLNGVVAAVTAPSLFGQHASSFVSATVYSGALLEHEILERPQTPVPSGAIATMAER
jgi:hypothetical protein